MDVQKFNPNKGDELPSEDDAFRLVLNDLRDKHNKSIPHVRSFSLSNEDKSSGYSLSVNWANLISPEMTIALVGLTFKANTREYKNYRNREIYSLNIGFIKAVTGIINVLYDPVINEPPIIGYPNNPSHSLCCFSEEEYNKNEPFIILQLRNHAKERKVAFNLEEVDKIIEKERLS